MFAGNERSPINIPAELDCDFFLLPTVAGLSQNEAGLDGRSNNDLWNALADAVLSDTCFDEEAFERDRDAKLAVVIDLDAHRDARRGEHDS